MIHYLLVYYVTVYGMPADSYLLRENDRRLEMSEITNEIKKRRTFAIISHPDAGKTTLTEKFCTEEPSTRQDLLKEKQLRSMRFPTGWRLRRREVFL